MRKSFILLLAFFLCVTGYAQKLTISGVVIDKDLNEPLTGVNVLVKGTTTGTITDFDGKYTLEADANSILVFSYLSMKTIEEPVNGRTKIDVTMVSDAEALDEVVVTAMGIKRESKTLTYSAQTVGGKDLNEIKNVNMINSLQGKSAGLQITPNSTGAGGSSKILFRGNKSISGNNQPLIVVDGVPMMMNVSDSQIDGSYGGGRDGGDAMSTHNPLTKPDTEYGKRLEKLTGHIKEVDGLKVNFGVYEVVDVNAFACGDGSVRICAGLMDIMTDDEVMAVVGHEIGHVIHTDSKDAMKSAYLRSAVKNAAGAASSTVSKLTDSELGAMAEALAGAQYSQKQETEADDYGFEFSIKHNLDPYAMYNALNKLLELSADAPKESKFQKMFSSHPDTAKRVARAKEKADEYMKNKQ